MCDNAFLPYFPALLTAIIAGAAAWLTYLQHRTNALRLKHELFERRYKVYDSFRSFISNARLEGKTSQAACLSFLIEANQAEFLFGPEIPEYLNSVYKKGLDLLSSDRRLGSEGQFLVGDERNRVAHENAEQVKWLGDQLEVAPERFRKYLNLTR